jgi:hypothetical protein
MYKTTADCLAAQALDKNCECDRCQGYFAEESGWSVIKDEVKEQ